VATISKLVLFIFLFAGCAYRIGPGELSLPGGYKQVAIPVFKNRSSETGIEVSFTQALQQEFFRSRVGRVVDEPVAEIKIIGEILSVQYIQEAKRAAGDSSAANLPSGTVAASQYRILASVAVSVVRRSDGEVLWTSRFESERTYAAPLVTLAGVNSVNPLYNISARRQSLEFMANDMMIEAHNRMTENF
jgi:hypothetical protein